MLAASLSALVALLPAAEEEGRTLSPTTCSPCTNAPTPWMASQKPPLSCSGYLNADRCRDSFLGNGQKFCQRACFEAGWGGELRCCQTAACQSWCEDNLRQGMVVDTCANPLCSTCAGCKGAPSPEQPAKEQLGEQRATAPATPAQRQKHPTAAPPHHKQLHERPQEMDKLAASIGSLTHAAAEDAHKAKAARRHMDARLKEKGSDGQTPDTSQWYIDHDEAMGFGPGDEVPQSTHILKRRNSTDAQRAFEDFLDHLADRLEVKQGTLPRLPETGGSAQWCVFCSDLPTAWMRSQKLSCPACAPLLRIEPQMPLALSTHSMARGNHARGG